MAAKTYFIYNGPMVTTASPAVVATGTSIKTILQVKGAVPFRVIEYGCSFDGTSAATPGIVELVDTGTVFATVTASAVADIMPWGDPNAPANTSGTSGVPFNLGTSATGYTSSAEGSITATRSLDIQQIAPTSQFSKQFPLGREPEIVAGDSLRIRVKFGTSVDILAYVIVEV